MKPVGLMGREAYGVEAGRSWLSPHALVPRRQRPVSWRYGGERRVLFGSPNAFGVCGRGACPPRFGALRPGRVFPVLLPGVAPNSARPATLDATAFCGQILPPTGRSTRADSPQH